MDRLTTGRRRVGAGSVTDNGLFVNQASPAPCPETAPADVVPAAHRRGETRSRRLAELASTGVATAMLCGAVATVSKIGVYVS